MLVYFATPAGNLFATDDYPAQRYRDQYPAGTVEIDAPPSTDHRWIDGAWVFVEPVSVNPLHRDLSPAGFNWLLAYTGLDDVWAGLEAHFKTADRATYATLREAANRNTFRLTTTLAMVESFKAFAPDVDLSEETITAAWELAANRDADK